jgi:hypothetical protein
MDANERVIIAHGTHITENLQHHKANDVQRILEGKGFELSNTEDSVEHYKMPNSPENGKHTSISFDEQGFVKEEDGVLHKEDPGA